MSVGKFDLGEIDRKSTNGSHINGERRRRPDPQGAHHGIFPGGLTPSLPRGSPYPPALDRMKCIGGIYGSDRVKCGRLHCLQLVSAYTDFFSIRITAVLK